MKSVEPTTLCLTTATEETDINVCVAVSDQE